MIWAVSVLFCEFFLNVDRTIAKNGDSYDNYSNAYQAKIFWQKTNGMNTKSSGNTQVKRVDYLPKVRVFVIYG